MPGGHVGAMSLSSPPVAAGVGSRDLERYNQWEMERKRLVGYDLPCKCGQRAMFAAVSKSFLTLGTAVREAIGRPQYASQHLFCQDWPIDDQARPA